MFKPAVTAVAAVLACVALSASAHANVTDQTSCVRYASGNPGYVSIWFPLFGSSVTPGTRVYFTLYHYTSAGWQYTGRWNSLTATADPFQGAFIRWQWSSGGYMASPQVTFSLAARSGSYYVAEQVTLGSYVSPKQNVAQYDNWVSGQEIGWTSSCQS